MSTDQEPDRRRFPNPRMLSALVAAALFSALGGGYALAADGGSGNNTIKACANKRDGFLRLDRYPCKSSERRVTWSVRGIRGARGPRGPRGTVGIPGSPGAPATSLSERVEPGSTGGGANYTPAASDAPPGVTIGGQHTQTGQYTVGLGGANQPSLGQCTWTATPEGAGANAPDTTAVTSLVGSLIYVNLYNQAGSPVDDGFTIAIFCP
jgi:hypothetical protein